MVLNFGTSVHALRCFIFSVFLGASKPLTLCDAYNNCSPQFDGVLALVEDLSGTTSTLLKHGSN